LVISMSAREGFGSPPVWLCTRMSAPGRRDHRIAYAVSAHVRLWHLADQNRCPLFRRC
jgi:hypothetical protein